MGKSKKVKEQDAAPVEELQEVVSVSEEIVSEEIIKDASLEEKTEEAIEEKTPETKPEDAAPVEERPLFKIYQLIDRLLLSFVLDINGKDVRISFTGAVKMKNFQVNGKYHTDKKEIQDALEADKYFNTQYKLIHTEVIEPVAETEPVFEKMPDKTIVEKILTVQQAKEELLKRFPSINPDLLTNKQKILSEAQRRNIVFPNVR